MKHSRRAFFARLGAIVAVPLLPHSPANIFGQAPRIGSVNVVAIQAVEGVVLAVTGIITNFQASGRASTLSAIEQLTRN